MKNLTELMRTEIVRRYRSVRQFSLAVGIPLSTINSALTKGVGGSSYDNVVQMCRALGIHTVGAEGDAYITDDMERLINQYAALDTYGRHTVDTVLAVEHERCTNTQEDKAPTHSVNRM